MSWYKIVAHPLVNNSRGLWSGRVDIVRKDTEEIVKKVRVRLIKGKEQAEDLLDKEVKNVLQNIGLPKDWNNPDIVRLMFHEYRVFSRKREKYHQMIYEGGGKDMASHVLADHEQCILEYVLSFQEEYMKLTLKEKKRLIGATKEEREKPALLIDNLAARNFFMRIIVCPDREVVKAYKGMRALIEKEQKK